MPRDLQRLPLAAESRLMAGLQTFLLDIYLWLKALHLIGMVAWMAGMLYLPRLFVYHTTAPVGSQQSETFKVMERRLMRLIINPAMIATWVFGVAMLVAQPVWLSQGWMHLKLTALFGLTAVHGMLSRWRRQFANDANTRSQRFYRIVNEVPTVLLIVIIFMAVLKPF